MIWTDDPAYRRWEALNAAADLRWNRRFRRDGPGASAVDSFARNRAASRAHRVFMARQRARLDAYKESRG